MPRHPRIALTSRLRVHTTNDITGCPFGSPTRQSSARWPLSGADDYNLSQIIYYDDVDIWSLEPLVQIDTRRSAHELPKAILVSKIEHLTASILKNPFTMSKRSGEPLQYQQDAELLASSLELRGGGAYRDRTDDLMLAKQPLSQLS